LTDLLSIYWYFYDLRDIEIVRWYDGGSFISLYTFLLLIQILVCDRLPFRYCSTISLPILTIGSDAFICISCAVSAFRAMTPRYSAFLLVHWCFLRTMEAFRWYLVPLPRYACDSFILLLNRIRALYSPFWLFISTLPLNQICAWYHYTVPAAGIAICDADFSVRSVRLFICLVLIRWYSAVRWWLLTGRAERRAWKNGAKASWSLPLCVGILPVLMTLLFCCICILEYLRTVENFYYCFCYIPCITINAISYLEILFLVDINCSVFHYHLLKCDIPIVLDAFLSIRVLCCFCVFIRDLIDVVLFFSPVYLMEAMTLWLLFSVVPTCVFHLLIFGDLLLWYRWPPRSMEVMLSPLSFIVPVFDTITTTTTMRHCSWLPVLCYIKTNSITITISDTISWKAAVSRCGTDWRSTGSVFSRLSAVFSAFSWKHCSCTIALPDQY